MTNNQTAALILALAIVAGFSFSWMFREMKSSVDRQNQAIQACKDRGGEPIRIQSVGYRCFSPSAFK